jgi:hypothetical protein
LSDVDERGFVLNVDGGNVQELGYVEAHTMEQWMNTQGESTESSAKGMMMGKVQGLLRF